MPISKPLLGFLSPSLMPTVTGGRLTSDDTYYYRTFRANGTLSVSNTTLTADILVVAGGGGGGRSDRGGGGGGAGGLLYFTNQSLIPSNYSLTVGNGGPAATASNTTGTSGSNSVFGALTAAVGGGGGGRTGTTALTGGSGGGQGHQGTATNAAGTSGQGNSGGRGIYGGASLWYNGGGGGGAGGVGDNGTSTASGAGGIGTAYFGTTYAVGGKGGQQVGSSTANGVAGLGGGSATVNGAINTGGGGGGGTGSLAQNLAAGAGGSGIVIVRYEKSQAIEAIPVYMYESGNEFTSLTGGFTGFFTTANLPTYYSSGGYSIGTKTTSYMEVNMSGAGRRAQSLVAPNLIDLTPYSTIYADVEMITDTSSFSGLVVGFAGSTTNLDNVVADVSLNGVAARQIISKDISTVTSSGYPFIRGTTDPSGTAMNFRVYGFWLV